MKQVPWCPKGWYLKERPSFTLDPLLHAGAYYVQEASSMFLWHVLESVTDKRPQPIVLDLCAAPGGKSTLLSSFFPDGLVVSNEVIKSRVSVLQENLVKWGNENVIITNNDSRDFQRLPAFFDVIVTDVPCSGSGLFRRDPEAVNEWSPGNVTLCSQRQQRILADIIPSLKKDGVLIYSTCSYSREEDETIVDWIVTEFGLEPVNVPVAAEWAVVTSQSAVHRAPGYRFFPDKVQGEGFFIAAFRQRQEVREPRQKEATLASATQKERTALSAFLPLKDEEDLFRHNEVFHVFPAMFLKQLRVLSSHLYIRLAGIAVGSFKGKSFVPEHALATSLLPHHLPTVAVNKTEALQYLRKQDVHFDAVPGWCLVTYQGLGLGWIKQLSNRTNNYYPSEWRILKA